jgi:hypothetical protein
MGNVKTDPPNPEFARFDAGIRQLLTVPRKAYQERLEALKAKPGTRGPKRKVKPSASPDPAAPLPS